MSGIYTNAYLWKNTSYVWNKINKSTNCPRCKTDTQCLLPRVSNSPSNGPSLPSGTPYPTLSNTDCKNLLPQEMQEVRLLKETHTNKTTSHLWGELLSSMKWGKLTAPEDSITYQAICSLLKVEGNPLLKFYSFNWCTSVLPGSWIYIL